MSASKKQIKANRANAKKSTGPKTIEGKRISSRNAITHGLYATDLIVSSPHLKENQAEYDLILASLNLELQPNGVLQEFLVRKIANCLWRSGRVLRAETAQIKRQLHFMSDSLPHNIAVGVASIPKGAAGGDILRYELRVERQLNRSLNLLLRLKKAETSSLSDSYMDYLNSKLPDVPQDLAPRSDRNPFLLHPENDECPVPAGLVRRGGCDLPVMRPSNRAGKNPSPHPTDEDSNIVGPPENEQTNPISLTPEDNNSLPDN